MIKCSKKLETLEFIVHNRDEERAYGDYLSRDVIQLDTLHSFSLDLRIKTDVGKGLLKKLRFPSLRTLKVAIHPTSSDSGTDPHQIAESLSKLLDGIESQVTCEFDDPRLSAWIESSKSAQ